MIDWAELEAAALAAQKRAHAPYSRYLVGAAIRAASGRIFAGCNVENASYGLSICAERNAVGQMVAAGEREMEGIVVVTLGPVLGTPCGACRQVLAEFARDLPIRLMVTDGAVPARVTTLEALLPEAFREESLVPSVRIPPRG